MYLGVGHLGTLFLRSLYDFLFKIISHHGSFLLQSYMWMDGWDALDGWDPCVGLFYEYEHRFAVLKSEDDPFKLL